MLTRRVEPETVNESAGRGTRGGCVALPSDDAVSCWEIWRSNATLSRFGSGERLRKLAMTKEATVVANRPV